MKSIQEKIKARRLKLGLSLEDVAKELGVNKTTVMRYESKSIEKMPIDVIPPLAKILKCSPEYLMGWEEESLTEVKIEFNPREVLFDVTNSVYSDATTVTTTNIDGKTYINGFTIKIDAISSREIRFYKVDVNQDYTYPNGSNDKSIITISSEEI